MKPIKNWQSRPLRCYFCGSSQSVKYEVDCPKVGHTVYACNKCALLKEGADNEQKEKDDC